MHIELLFAQQFQNFFGGKPRTGDVGREIKSDFQRIEFNERRRQRKNQKAERESSRPDAHRGPEEKRQWRIKKRGRAYEKAISSSYLQELSEAYSHYFYRYDETPLLVVNSTEIDFVNTPEHFEQLVEQVRNAQKGTQYYVPLGS